MSRPCALLTLSLLAACAAEETATPDEAAAALAPPPTAEGLELSIDGALQPGGMMTFRVEGANPLEDVYLAFGFNTIAATGARPLCPDGLQGLCLGVRNPQLLPVPGNPVRADASGVATLTVRPPSTLPDGLVAYFEAAQVGADAATSNVVPRFSPLDTGGALVGVIGHEAAVTPGVQFDGVYEETYLALSHGLDVCTLEMTTSATGLGSLPPCPGCDFAFEVTFTDPREATVAGDCQDLLGFDPSGLAPFDQGLGFQSGYLVPGYGYYDVWMFYDTGVGDWTWITTGASYAGGQFTGSLTIGYYAY